MPLYAYVDDSGSDPQSPVYVLGGLVLPEDTWEYFSGDWKGVLHRHPPVKYFPRPQKFGTEPKGHFGG